MARKDNLQHTALSKEQKILIPALRILLIDENRQGSEFSMSALNKYLYKTIHLANPDMSVLKQVDETQPDIILIDIESPSRDILESLSTISDYNPKPIVMFPSEEDTDTINHYIESGVSAYIVGDLQAQRVRLILDTAVARFREFQKLKVELSDTKQQRASRNLMDHAKRLLMKKNIYRKMTLLKLCERPLWIQGKNWMM